MLMAGCTGGVMVTGWIDGLVRLLCYSVARLGHELKQAQFFAAALVYQTCF